MKITIIGIDNNAGLEKDKEILTELLQGAHIDVAFRDIRYFTPVDADTDLCIHLEIVDKRFFGKRNILIPNQEWFMTDWINSLDKFEAIFCKSRYAYNIFSGYHKNVQYTGFTSRDCYTPSHKVKECFHAAGKSKIKGTDFLIEAWEDYAEATIHIASKNIDPATITNKFITSYNYLPEIEYNFLRNRSLIHIYPSQMEGFGHCINESMSCGAVVITTDYPPMNELGCKFLIPFQKAYAFPDRLGGVVFIAPSSIQETIDKVLLREDLHELGAESRRYFLANDLQFRQRFMSALQAL